MSDDPDDRAYTMDERIVAQTLASAIAVNMPQVPNDLRQRAARAAIEVIRASVSP